MKFLLCLRCSTTRVAPTAERCCGELELAVNPFSGERRRWYQASTKGREGAIFEAANYRTKAQHWRSLARASRAKGREIGRVA